MADARQAERMARLAELRDNAYAHGGPVGRLLCRSFETILTVVKDGIGNETSVSLALESFNRERELYYGVDLERTDPQHELLYNISEAISVMIQSILDERNDPPREDQPSRHDDSTQVSQEDDCASDVTLPKFDPAELLKMEEDIITLDDSDEEDQPCSSRQAQSSNGNQPYRSSLLDAYEAHVGSAPAAAPASLSCTICDLTFPTDEKLREDTACWWLPFICITCDLTFTTDEKLRVHELQHTIMPCHICGARMPMGQTMKHLNDEHPPTNGLNKPVPLFRTWAEQKIEDEEDQEWKQETGGRDSVRSDTATPGADSSLVSSSAASTPAASTPAAAAPEFEYAAPATGLLLCTHLGCTFSSATQHGLKCHWKVHSAYKCDICGRPVMSAEKLERHMEKFHLGETTKKPTEDKKQKRKRRKRWGWAESEDEDYRPRGSSSRKNSAAAAAAAAACFISASAAAAAVAAAAEAEATAAAATQQN